MESQETFPLTVHIKDGGVRNDQPLITVLTDRI